jgi:non-homologous end joining protein Ku
MIEAKLKGEGIEDETAPEPAPTNVIDLMAALRKSLSESDPSTAAPVAAADAKGTKAAKPVSAKASPSPSKARKRAS